MSYDNLYSLLRKRRCLEEEVYDAANFAVFALNVCDREDRIDELREARRKLHKYDKKIRKEMERLLGLGEPAP